MTCQSVTMLLPSSIYLHILNYAIDIVITNFVHIMHLNNDCIRICIIICMSNLGCSSCIIITKYVHIMH
ncbi:hypothetical protein L2E82_19798 [Cichorium intybus]|uniref:Uncharacterized protein n=1 Tax=Cichorium intybus TaxID=13427 RepID=A0ACB9DRV3_CICIN|nr:hypothetical protein L2E82_19798 [Cichorium intybus]